jgi:predicted transcriptional regulator YheO
MVNEYWYAVSFNVKVLAINKYYKTVSKKKICAVLCDFLHNICEAVIGLLNINMEVPWKNLQVTTKLATFLSTESFQVTPSIEDPWIIFVIFFVNSLPNIWK